MPAVSKAQQKFMGMVHAAQKGEEPASPEVAKAAASMDKGDAKDFASTSHKGLPDKKEESMNTLKEYIRKLVREMNATGNVGGYATPFAFGKKSNEKAKGKKQADLTGYSVVDEAKDLDKQTLAKIFNVPKGAQRVSAKKERYGYTIKYDDPDTGAQHTAFLSNVRIDQYLKGNLKETISIKNTSEEIYKAIELVAEKIGLNIKNVIKGKIKIYTDSNFTVYDIPNQSINRFDIRLSNDESKIIITMPDSADMSIKNTVYENKLTISENRWLELKNEETPTNAKIDKGISNINKQLAEMEKFLNWYGRLKQENGVTNDQFWKRTNRNIYSIKERLIKLEQKIRKISE